MNSSSNDKFEILQSPELFEKVIVNLNLTQCPKSLVLNFIKYSEEHFLTTAIISLYTQLFERKENASCVQLLFSLYDLYRRATD
jgi:capsular polysaccharide biosynthesis protein